MHDSRVSPVGSSTDLSLEGLSIGDERNLVRGGFERLCSYKRGLRLDEDPVVIDDGHLEREVRAHLSYFGGFRMNAAANYGGVAISTRIGMIFPGEGPTTHGLVEILAKDGRQLCLVEPQLLPVERGVILHHVTVAPGMPWRPMVPLFSPRAYEAEVAILREASLSPALFSSLESRSALYGGIRSALVRLREGGIPVTRELRAFESVGAGDEPSFRLVCGDHPEVVVGVRYDRATCSIRYDLTHPRGPTRA